MLLWIVLAASGITAALFVLRHVDVEGRHGAVPWPITIVAIEHACLVLLHCVSLKHIGDSVFAMHPSFPSPASFFPPSYHLVLSHS